MRARSDGRAVAVREGPNHSESREVHPGRPEAGSAKRRDHASNGFAPSGDYHHVEPALAIVPAGVAHHLPIQHGLVEGHGHEVLGLEADRRLELLVIVDRRKPQKAHRDPLARETEADGLGELVVCEQLLQNGSELLPIGDLALTHHTGGERHRPEPRNRRMPVGRHLGGGDAARLDVQAHQSLVLLCREHPCHRPFVRLGFQAPESTE